MLVESKIHKWIEAGLAAYRASPLLVESVFYDASQEGYPGLLGPGLLQDASQLWLPNEYAGGVLRWAQATFPIIGNTSDTLIVTGDPSLLEDVDTVGYQIVPPETAELSRLLETATFSIQTSFAQVPAPFPCFTIRLERDTQGDTWVGEAMDSYVMHGVEVDVNRSTMTASYLLSIWANNRDATLWLYAWLQNHALRSLQQFAAWGLYDVSLGGSDLDPALQFLPERTHVRHCLFTATRQQRAINVQDVEYVTDLYLKVIAQYAPFHLTLDAGA